MKLDERIKIIEKILQEAIETKEDTIPMSRDFALEVLRMIRDSNEALYVAKNYF